MKSGTLSVLLSILCAYGTNGQAPDCSKFSNGALIAHPTAPNQYYMCSNGIPIPLTCNDGLVYCSNLIRCAASCDVSTNPTTAATTASPVTSPTTVTTPTTAKPTTAPTTIKTTVTTASTTKAPVTAATPTSTPQTTQTTAPTTVKTTTPSWSSTPTPPQDKCNGLLNGTLFGITGNCSGYVMCVDNVSVPGQCLGGLKFDPVIGRCTQTKCP